MRAFFCFIAVFGVASAARYQTITTPSYNTPPYATKYQQPSNGYTQPKASYGNTGYETTYNIPPAKYSYQYEVNAESPAPYGGYGDSYAAPAPVEFGAQESREGDYTTGKYHVLLPDGRVQTVDYYVNGYSGYVADVKYQEPMKDGYQSTSHGGMSSYPGSSMPKAASYQSYEPYATTPKYQMNSYQSAPSGGKDSYQSSGSAMNQESSYNPYPAPTTAAPKPYQASYNPYGGNSYSSGAGSSDMKQQTYSAPSPMPYDNQQYPPPQPYNNPPYSSY